MYDDDHWFLNEEHAQNWLTENPQDFAGDVARIEGAGGLAFIADRALLQSSISFEDLPKQTQPPFSNNYWETMPVDWHEFDEAPRTWGALNSTFNNKLDEQLVLLSLANFIRSRNTGEVCGLTAEINEPFWGSSQRNTVTLTDVWLPFHPNAGNSYGSLSAAPLYASEGVTACGPKFKLHRDVETRQQSAKTGTIQPVKVSSDSTLVIAQQQCGNLEIYPRDPEQYGFLTTNHLGKILYYAAPELLDMYAEENIFFNGHNQREISIAGGNRTRSVKALMEELKVDDVPTELLTELGDTMFDGGRVSIVNYQQGKPFHYVAVPTYKWHVGNNYFKLRTYTAEGTRLSPHIVQERTLDIGGIKRYIQFRIPHNITFDRYTGRNVSDQYGDFYCFDATGMPYVYRIIERQHFKADSDGNKLALEYTEQHIDVTLFQPWSGEF